jgi:hypothetical protein
MQLKVEKKGNLMSHPSSKLCKSIWKIFLTTSTRKTLIANFRFVKTARLEKNGGFHTSSQKKKELIYQASIGSSDMIGSMMKCLLKNSLVAALWNQR